MIDQTGITVSDFAKSKAWYQKALAPLGYGVLMELSKAVAGVDVAGFGEVASKKPDFWISGTTPGRESPGPGVHVAFQARKRADVDAFHRAALGAGGTDNGAPGLRPHYHPNYYGAFVRDLDGHNIEAVCHAPA